MTLSEFYSCAGGDYKEVIGRIGNEILVERFLIKFLQDPSFVQLATALEEKIRGMDMSGYEPYFEEVQRVYHRVSGMLQQYITEKNGKQV